MSYSSARVRPLLVNIAFPKPTISMVKSQAASPLAVTVTLKTPTVTLEVAPSPLAVTVTIVTPTVV